MSTTLPDDSVSPFDSDDGDYDPFEEFNRSAGIGVVENPYPMFALVRAEHTMKREDFDETMIPESEDLELLNFMRARRRASTSSPRTASTRCSRC